MSETTMNQTAALEGAQLQDPSRSTAGPGAWLASQRKVHGWTIEQVASQLNLAPRQIEALETDNHAALPGIASVRGFIRAYAKLLKMEAEPLLAMIANEAPPPLNEAVPMRRALPTPFTYDSRFPLMNSHGKPSKSIMALVVIILLALAGGAYQMGWIPAMPASSSLKAQGPTSAPTAEPVVVPEVATAQADTTNAIGNTAVLAATNPANANGNMNAGTAVQPLPVVPNAAATVDGAAAASRDALVLKLREDSWIEIQHANSTGTNNVLISRVVKAGSTETFNITEPVSITIGNAAGVDVSLRGVPVDIKSNTKTNIARLNLK